MFPYFPTGHAGRYLGPNAKAIKPLGYCGVTVAASLLRSKSQAKENRRRKLVLWPDQQLRPFSAIIAVREVSRFAEGNA
jgi:hypothetical protein